MSPDALVTEAMAVDAVLWLARQLRDATLVGLLGLGIAALLGRRWPRAAHAVVLLALARFVLPPPLALHGVDLPRGLPPWLDPAAEVAGPAVAPWAGAALALWALGVVLVAAACLWRRRDLRAVERHGTTLTAGPLYERAVALSSRLGLRRVPRLVIAETPGPYAAGVLRPRVVLPPDVATMSGGRLDAVLAHELVHHRRRDLAAAWLAAVVVAFAWMHPLAWLLARRLRELREDCCDDEVLRAGVADAAAYADALLAVARPPQPLAVGMAAAPHPLCRRLARLLARGGPPPRQRRAVALAVVLFGAVALLRPGSGREAEVGDGEVIRLRVVERIETEAR